MIFVAQEGGFLGARQSDARVHSEFETEELEGDDEAVFGYARVSVVEPALVEGDWVC